MSWLKIHFNESADHKNHIYLLPDADPPPGYRFFARVLRPAGHVKQTYWHGNLDNPKSGKEIKFDDPLPIEQEFDLYIKEG